MSSHGANRFPTHHGYGEVRVTRYLALYIAQAGWIVLGIYLNFHAMWPSSCMPDNLWEVYACSIYLPENGGWEEASLLTWLWATPILVMLEISRRMNKGEE